MVGSTKATQKSMYFLLFSCRNPFAHTFRAYLTATPVLFEFCLFVFLTHTEFVEYFTPLLKLYWNYGCNGSPTEFGSNSMETLGAISANSALHGSCFKLLAASKDSKVISCLVKHSSMPLKLLQATVTW
nr:hypothetical protein [Crucivirus sp.]